MAPTRKGASTCGSSVHTGIFKPDVAAVLRVEPVLTVGEAARLAAGTLSVVRAIEEGDVLVSNVTKPGISLAKLLT